jgi:hypothetical protein
VMAALTLSTIAALLASIAPTLLLAIAALLTSSIAAPAVVVFVGHVFGVVFLGLICEVVEM